MNTPERSNPLNIYRSAFLKGHIPSLDASKVIEYLNDLTQDQINQLVSGNFGSLAFDTIFSPGVVPEPTETKYRQAYSAYFYQNLGLEIFGQDGKIQRPKEDKFYHDQKLKSLHPEFIRDWVVHLRTVNLMINYLRPDLNPTLHIGSNFTEAALCRMIEHGEQMPEDLFSDLPILMQEKLMKLFNRVQSKGSLLPQHPRVLYMAHALEDNENKFNAETRERISMVDQTILENRDRSIVPESSEIQLTPLSILLKNPAQVTFWRNLLLGKMPQ